MLQARLTLRTLGEKFMPQKSGFYATKTSGEDKKGGKERITLPADMPKYDVKVADSVCVKVWEGLPQHIQKKLTKKDAVSFFGTALNK